jgi:hypothetical protein
MWITFLAEASGLTDVTSLGAAGMMGAMWLWERRTSRQREEQLDDAHARILGDRVQLEQLIDVVRGNAEALTKLTATHEELIRRMSKDA